MKPPYSSPPKWADRFLEWGLTPEFAEDIMGDVRELFQENFHERGRTYAQWKYFLQILGLLRLFKWVEILAALLPQNPLTMYQHYLKIAVRNLRKHAGYSAIHILGLTFGLATCLMCILYIHHELSFDKFHDNIDQIYRVNTQFSGAYAEHTSVTPAFLGPLLEQNLPEVTHSVRMYYGNSFAPTVVAYEDNIFQETGMYYGDSAFFSIFSFPLLEGNPRTVLNRPKTIVINQKMADKYFGGESPVGKTLTLNDKYPYEITGLMADAPANSHFHPDLIASFSSLRAAKEVTMGPANYHTYIQLEPSVSTLGLSDKIAQVVAPVLGDSPNEAISLSFDLLPVSDIHLRSNVREELEVGGDIRYIYLFSTIAVLILLIACINYMNLATAKSMDRAKEVGLRKVIGAHRSQIFGQFIGETLIITLLSMIGALILVRVSLPFFNNLANRTISLEVLNDPSNWILGFGLLLFVSFLAGAYPSIVFANFQPIRILRGSFRGSFSGQWLRKSLVVVQFAISMILLVAAMVMYKQNQFIQNKKLGYEKSHVLVLPIPYTLREKLAAIKGDMSNLAQVSNVSSSSESLVTVRGTYNLHREGGSDNSIDTKALIADPNFISTMGLQILQGTDLSTSPINEENRGFILNETAVNALGFSQEESIGKKVELHGRKGYIRGIVKDFHIASLHKPIGPLVIFREGYSHGNAIVRISPNSDISQVLASLRAIWKDQAPTTPFEFKFLDEELDRLYIQEKQSGQLFAIFSGLAILIASLGLFGLAAFTIIQRSKEISIRKVLGATVTQVLALLSKDFLLLVGIAMLIGLPLGWYFLDQWLDNFAYKTTIGMDTLLLAGLFSFVLAIITISYQSIRVAMTNPAEYLKDE